MPIKGGWDGGYTPASSLKIYMAIFSDLPIVKTKTINTIDLQGNLHNDLGLNEK